MTNDGSGPSARTAAAEGRYAHPFRWVFRVPRAALPDEDDEEDVRKFLAGRKSLKHLRVRRRADRLALESGRPTLLSATRG